MMLSRRQRVALLSALTGQGTLSVDEIAQRRGRDVQAVRDDVARLLNAGIVECDGDGIRFDYGGLDFAFSIPADRLFTAIVHKDEGSAYGLSFPDLPGCFAAADSWADVQSAAVEALDLWFEDAEDVEPDSLDATRARPEVQAELAEGARLITVPWHRR